MKNKGLRFTLIALFLSINILFLVWMNFYHEWHFAVVHLMYLVIVFTAFAYRKILFPVTFALIAIHLALDYLEMDQFTINPIIESLLQFIFAFLFYVLLTRIERSQVRYKNAIDSAQLGTWEWNIQTGHCTFNERWADMIGYDIKEIEPHIRSWIKHAHPEDLQVSNQSLENVFQKRERFYDVTVRMKHKEGHWIWVRDRGEVIQRNLFGKPILMVGTHWDVTEEKVLEQALSHSHDLMQYIIHHSQSAIAVHDNDLRYLFVSQKYIEQYQVKETNIIGKHHYDVFPDLPQKWRDVHQRVLKGEIVSADRDIYIKANGSHEWTRWECRPWYEKDGSIGGLIVYTEVITKLIEKEVELENTTQMLSSIMNHMPIGIALNTVHPSVKFTYMNDHFPALYGTTKERLMSGESFWEVVYEDEHQRKKIQKQVEKDALTMDPSKMQWHHVPILKDGKIIRYVSAYNLPVKDSDMQISIVMDVTEQKTKEEEILKLSYQDFLTGIPNRRYLSVAFEEMEDQQLYPIGLMIMDLNGLKLINDTFGQEKGNQALCQVADVLKAVKRENDVIARIGGDEFVMLLPSTDETALLQMKNQIEERIEINTIENIHYSLGIGLAIKEDQHESYQESLRRAEEDMYKRKVLEGRSTRNRAIMGILTVLTDKFAVEKRHSERVSDFCYQIGKALNLSKDELEELKLAGLLHDIGKVSVPDDILDKPAKLNPTEWVSMKEHTIHGYNILRAADEYSNLALYALTHHEKMDGTGYPNGLTRDEIPLFSRIIAVADAYEAMTSDRPYRLALSKKQAIDELLAHSGTQFDEQITAVFIDQVLNVE